MLNSDLYLPAELRDEVIMKEKELTGEQSLMTAMNKFVQVSVLFLTNTVSKCKIHAIHILKIQI